MTHPNPKPKALDARRAAIESGLARGVSLADMAEEFGMSTTWLRTLIREDAGLSLPKKPRGPNHRDYHVGAIGRVSAAIAREDDEFREWLRDNIPEDSTVADFLISVAVDVFREETTPDKAKATS